MLSRQLLSSLAVQAIAAALAFVVQFSLANAMGASEYGAFTFLYSILYVGATWARFGGDVLLLRLGGAAMARGELAKLRLLNCYASRNALAAGIVLSAGLSVVITLTGNVYAMSTVVVAMLLIAPLAIAQIRQSTLLAHGRTVGAFVPEGIVRQGTMLLMLACAWLSGANVTAVQGYIFMLLSCVASYVVSRQLLEGDPNIAGSAIAVDRNESEWMKLSLAYLVLNGVVAIMYQVDVLTLGRLVSSQELGIYQVAKQVSTAGIFALSAAQQSYASQMAGHIATRQFGKLRQLYVSVLLIGFVCSLLVLAVGYLLAHFVPTLLGNEFVRAKSLISIMLCGNVAISLLGPVGALAIMSGRQSMAILCQVGGIVLASITIPVAVARYGVMGGAIAYIGSTSAMLFATALSLVSAPFGNWSRGRGG